MKDQHSVMTIPGRIPYKWKALLPVAMGTMLVSMDAGILNIAFPVLTKALNTDLTTVIWVNLAYLLISTSLMPVLGKASDLFGRKRFFCTGLTIINIGLITCAMVQGVGQLIFFRIIQAFGAALCLSCGNAIIREAFPVEETGKGLGTISLFSSFGLIAAPVCGGLMLHWISWRSIFYLRVPISLAALIMAIFLLKENKQKKESIIIDYKGIFTSGGGVFCFVLGISQMRHFGFKSVLVYGLICAGIGLLVLMIMYEKKAREPIIDITLFRNPLFTCGITSLFLIFVAIPTYLLIMPFYLMQGIGMSPSNAGLLLGIPAALSLILGPLSGFFSDRLGRSRFTTLGAIAFSLVYSLLFFQHNQSALFIIIIILLIQGIANGTFHPPNYSAIMANVPSDRFGTAAALTATFRQVGACIGIAMAGALFSAKRLAYENILKDQGISFADARRAAIPLAFHDVLIISIIISACVVFISIYTLKKEASQSRPECLKDT
ncbi:MFS transporter [Thermodesulfobacteriota bacterium]